MMFVELEKILSLTPDPTNEEISAMKKQLIQIKLTILKKKKNTNFSVIRRKIAQLNKTLKSWILA